MFPLPINFKSVKDYFRLSVSSGISLQAIRNSILLLLFFPFYLLAQEPQLQPIGLAEGLPSQTVYDMLEDPKGYLWVGTDQGIFRYNGKRFEAIPLPNARDLNLDNLLLDNEHHIWAKNYANQLFEWSDLGWKEHQLDTTVIKDLGSLRQLSLDKSSVVLVYEKGVVHYEPNTQKLTRLYSAERPDQVFHYVHFQHVNSDAQKQWLSVGQQVLYNGKPLPLPNKTPITQSLWVDSSLYWVSRSAMGQAGWLTEADIVKLVPPEISNPFYWRQTHDSNLWLCSADGAWFFGQSPHTLKPIHYLAGKRISDVLIDREGNRWFSSLDEGLWLQPNQGIYHVKTALDDLPKGSYPTRLLATNDGGMWVGTQNGWIVQLDTEGNPVYKFDTGSGSEVEFLHEDLVQGRLLFTQGWLDLTKTKPTFHPIYLSRALDVDDSGNYLIASGSVASMLSSTLDRLPSHPFLSILPTLEFGYRYPALQLYEGRTRRIMYRSADSTYFLATVDGLMALDKTGNRQEIRTNDGQKLIARDIRLDKYDRLWVATQQGSLAYLNLTKKLVQVPNPHHGLIERLYPTANVLWLLSGQHVYALNLNSLEQQWLPILSSLKRHRLYDISVQDSILWLATNQGLLQVNYEQQSTNEPPYLHFRGIFVDGKPWPESERISHKNRQISLDFDLIHHASLGDNTLWYRFVESGNEWVEVPNQQSRITFEAAASGNYHLEVRAEAAAKLSATIPIRFKVAYPFWLQPIGLSLILGTIIGLAAIGIRIYVQRMRREQIQKEAMLQARLTALRSQMNPHFLFNVLNSVQGYIYGNQKSLASEYLKQFSTLIRGFLSHSDRTSIGLDEEIALLKTYISLESARMEEVQVHWEIDDAIDLSDWKLPPGLIQPFVENAFKHGLLHREGARHLWLRFWVEGPKLHLQIEDNGIGRKAAEAKKRPQSHQSFATQATTERIRLLQELGEFSPSCTITDLFDENQQPKGTLVDLAIMRKNT